VRAQVCPKNKGPGGSSREKQEALDRVDIPSLEKTLGPTEGTVAGWRSWGPSHLVEQRHEGAAQLGRGVGQQAAGNPGVGRTQHLQGSGRWQGQR